MHTDLQASLHQADLLLNNGHTQQAETLYSDIIRQHPTAHEAYFKLALLAEKEGKTLSARKTYQKAFRLAPTNSAYLLKLAELFHKSGRTEDALELIEQFLRANQTPPEVNFDYAKLLINYGRPELAIQPLQSCIHAKPQELSYYMQLAGLLYNLARFKESLAVFTQAYQCGLSSEGLLLNLAKLNIDFGQINNAKEILAQGVRQFPKTLAFSYRLQSIDSTYLKDDFFASLTDRKATLPAQEHFYYYWLLAQQAGQKRQTALEFDYLLKAHHAFKNSNSFSQSASAFIQKLKHLNSLGSSPLLESLTPLSTALAPIFIVGNPRCGSTLLESIIQAGEQAVNKGEETGIIFRAASKHLTAMNPQNWEHFKQECTALFQHLNLGLCNQRFTDKSLENGFMLELILALFPKARIVYCEREPMASILSILKTNMAVLPWAHDLDSILNYIDLSLQAIAQSKQKYPEQILTITYEKLVQDPEHYAKILMQFCDLPWHPACLDIHKRREVFSKTASHMQIRKEINTDALNKYDSYRALFEAYQERYPWLRARSSIS